jgi:4-hydroxy-tetrahydrodipicolinate reductase
MKIAIIGYGKMGKMIESIALDKGHEVGSCIDIHNPELLEPENLRQHDVVIEFTVPDSAFSNVNRCLDAGVPVVSGTTGWTGKLEPVFERVRRENGSFLYASNFSLGVNILFHMNRRLASIMNHYPQYDARMTEVHHTQKMDAPSGTAITLAEGLLSEIERKTSWQLAESGNQEPGNQKHDMKDQGKFGDTGSETGASGRRELFIEAIRKGNVPGIHEVTYESEFDEISIRHSAKDRRGFAMGAVLAAEYIHDKKGIFTMDDVLNL